MPSHPYEQTFKRDGELCFVAELPALAQIGKGFDALMDQWSHYQAPAEEIQPWRELSARLGQLVQEARGRSLRWDNVEAELKQRFPTFVSQPPTRIMEAVRELFDSGQMPLVEYLEWLLHEAETKWASYAGARNGPDMDAYMTRADRLSRRMQTAGYETEGDRQMKAENPARYAFFQQSAALAADAMRDPNPDAVGRMVEKQAELYRQSPLFAEREAQFEQMKRQIEFLKDADPKLYQQQLAAIEQIRQFAYNPSAAMANFPTPGEFDDEDHELDDDAGDSANLPAGQFRFTCGKRKQISPKQVALFEQLVASQHAMRPQIEKALRELHRWMAEGDAAQLPNDRVLFPENSDQSDVPLRCFQVTRIALDDNEGRIVLSFHTPCGHFAEHGCHLAIKDGKVDQYGTWEQVYGD